MRLHLVSFGLLFTLLSLPCPSTAWTFHFHHGGGRRRQEPIRSSSTEKDHYRVLGVSNRASTDEIRKAYKRLAREWHPDRNQSPEAQGRFVEISTAHEVLSDERKRREYDLSRGGVRRGFDARNFHQQQFHRQRQHHQNQRWHQQQRWQKTSQDSQVKDLIVAQLPLVILLLYLAYVLFANVDEVEGDEEPEDHARREQGEEEERKQDESRKGHRYVAALSQEDLSNPEKPFVVVFLIRKNGDSPLEEKSTLEIRGSIAQLEKSYRTDPVAFRAIQCNVTDEKARTLYMNWIEFFLQNLEQEDLREELSQSMKTVRDAQSVVDMVVVIHPRKHRFAILPSSPSNQSLITLCPPWINRLLDGLQPFQSIIDSDWPSLL